MSVSTAHKTAGQYYPYIDGLRALAVLAVFIYHLHGPWLPGGFVGVDVFFVISGFIVSASMAGFKGQGFWSFIGYFYARRIKRIVPALLVCLLGTAILTALFIPPSWLSSVNQQTGFYAIFGLSNFILAQSGRDYFAPTTEFNPYTHTWSLGVEEQFYLIFPLLFIGWLTGGRKRLVSTALFAALGFASLGWSAWQSWSNPTNAYFLTPSRFWELAAGALLFQLVSLTPPTNSTDGKRKLFRAAIGGFSIALLLAAFFISSPKRFPIPDVLLSIVGTLGLIWSLHGHKELRRLHAVLGSRPLVAIGRISYSLYLWHWPVFVLFRWTYGLETLSMKALAAALALLLAVASWRFVENPIRYESRLKKLPYVAVIASGLAAMVCIAGLTKILADNQRRVSLSVVTQSPDAWYPEGMASSPDHPGCTAFPTKSVVDGGLLLTFSPHGCETPVNLSKHTVYAIGDSHALAYHRMFQLFSIREATRVQVYANGGCPFLSLQPGKDVENPRCRPHIEAALRDMRSRIKPGDVLFLPSLRLTRLSDQWIYFGEERARKSVTENGHIQARQRAVANAVETLREFSDRGVIIVFEAPKPLFKSPPFRCADWFNRENPICEQGVTMQKATLDFFRQPVLQAFENIARQVPGVTIWDPYPVLCPESECSVWKDGKPLFLDGDHVSGYGNETLLPSFTDAIRSRLATAQAAR
ncbi:acyltransferase [Microvirga sp. ACRRW]|uniref:acyltransferase family protein n=1 Tax=Microvirga sp. ACRRW TaxID=2918205 RepID=UPI001EF68A81|nr:acyltransferase family protein [Microvirga sp. ACRRW]MCG7394030.1 acyltransferase [Microvirga sp. ACRRW]